MIGEHAFCPSSGASLSQEIHHDEQGRPERAPESDDISPEASLEEPLTTGERRSSKRALSAYFRRCHRRHAEGDGDELHARAALAITRLKRAASDREQLDIVVWYALAEHLKREGFDVDWMAGHAEPRCPNCGGRLAYERRSNGVVGRCGTSCTGDRRDRLRTIRELVVALTERTFSGEPAPDADDLSLV